MVVDTYCLLFAVLYFLEIYQYTMIYVYYMIYMKYYDKLLDKYFDNICI